MDRQIARSLDGWIDGSLICRSPDGSISRSVDPLIAQSVRVMEINIIDR